MISKRDSKPFLIKFPIGINETNKSDMIYQDEWQTVYGLIGNPSGFIQAKVYGNELDFDKIITVNASSMTRQIAYDTIFMLDDMPTDNYPKGDYYPRYIYPEYNGEIVIGLDKVDSIKMPRLYFFSGDKLLYFQLNYDKNTHKGYVGANQIIPFGLNSYVWDRNPSNPEQTSHRFTFISREKIGYDEKYKPFSELTFIGENNEA